MVFHFIGVILNGAGIKATELLLLLKTCFYVGPHYSSFFPTERKVKFFTSLLLPDQVRG